MALALIFKFLHPIFASGYRELCIFPIELHTSSIDFRVKKSFQGSAGFQTVF